MRWRTLGAEVSGAGSWVEGAQARWGRVLGRFVREGMVDYAGLAADRGELKEYLREVGAVSEAEFNGLSRAAQMALLLNLYNAATLLLIAEHYPVASIKKIGGWFQSPWDLECVPLFGGKVSLNVVEHQRLRPRYQEPRIHFALVCAARGCPPLREEPYDAARLDAQLSDQARRFLAHSDKNRFDASTRTLTLSPIFKWYVADFPSGTAGVIAFLKPFLPAATAAAIGTEPVTIAYSEYDWRLNSRPTASSSHER